MAGMGDFAVNLRHLLAAMVRQARDLRLQQTASSLTVLSLMALVPIAALGLLVLTALPAFESMRQGLQTFIERNVFLPAISATVMRSINQFVASAKDLSAIGTLGFLATALGAMLTIDHTLNGIWRTARARPLWQRLTLYWAMLTVGPVLLAAALTLQARARTGLVGAAGLLDSLAPVLPGLVVIAAFTLLYRLAPNERVRFGHALAGAVLAAVLLEGLRAGLGVYIRLFPTYTLVYGALAVLPTLLVWLFAAWMSVLLGALLAANLRFWGLPTGDPHRQTPQAEFNRMVAIVGEIARAAPAQVPSARFQAAFDRDARAADRAADRLARLGYIVRVWPLTASGSQAGVWDEWWLPAPGLESMTLMPLFDRVWGAGQSDRSAQGGLTVPGTEPHPGADWLSRPIAQVLMPDLSSDQTFAATVPDPKS